MVSVFTGIFRSILVCLLATDQCQARPYGKLGFQVVYAAIVNVTSYRYPAEKEFDN
jgi:hypothetical protein